MSPLWRALGVSVPLLLLAPCGCNENSTDPKIGPPSRGVQTHIEKFTIDPGKETEKCAYFKLDNDEELYINGFEMSARTGLHHSNVMVVGTSIQDKTTDCFGIPEDVMNNPAAFPRPVYQSSTQVPSETVTLPRGVAVKIAPRQQVVYNYHYLNATSEPIEGEIYLNFHSIDPAGLTAEANIAVIGTLDIHIPPRGTQTTGTRCQFEKDVQLGSLSPHTHQKGKRLTVRRIGGDRDGETLLETTEWNNPESASFDPPLLIAKGEGIEIECEYLNDTDEEITFGPTSKHEMCFVFGYVFPASDTLYGLDLGDEDSPGCTVTEGLNF